MFSELTVSGCGHVFHQICITESLDTDNRCPLCRKRLQKHGGIINLAFSIQISSEAQARLTQYFQSLNNEETTTLITLLQEKDSLFEQTRQLNEQIIAAEGENTILANSIQEQERLLEQFDVTLVTKTKELEIKGQAILQAKQQNVIIDKNCQNLQQNHTVMEKQYSNMLNKEKQSALRRKLIALGTDPKREQAFFDNLLKKSLEEQADIFGQAFFLKSLQLANVQSQINEFEKEKKVLVEKIQHFDRKLAKANTFNNQSPRTTNNKASLRKIYKEMSRQHISSPITKNNALQTSPAKILGTTQIQNHQTKEKQESPQRFLASNAQYKQAVKLQLDPTITIHEAVPNPANKLSLSLQSMITQKRKQAENFVNDSFQKRVIQHK